MTHHFELQYPLAGAENANEEDMIEAAAQRIGLTELFTITESATYQPEILALTDDAYSMLRVVQAMRKGEKVVNTGEPKENLEQAIVYAAMLSAAIGVGDDRPDEITPGVLWQLSQGLENLLRRLKASGLDTAEAHRICDYAAEPEREGEDGREAEEQELADEPVEDPLSPAALEKSIGIEGLRRLHKAIARDSDAVLNHIECYVETREDALFEPDDDEYGSFEEQRSTRKKSDPTKPLGYYDEKGDPIESA